MTMDLFNLEGKTEGIYIDGGILATIGKPANE